MATHAKVEEQALFVTQPLKLFNSVAVWSLAKPKVSRLILCAICVPFGKTESDHNSVSQNNVIRARRLGSVITLVN